MKSRYIEFSLLKRAIIRTLYLIVKKGNVGKNCFIINLQEELKKNIVLEKLWNFNKI